MLLSRYGSSVLDLDIYYGFELIKKVYENRNNERLWDMWLALYPNMDKDHFISFEDYKNKIIGNPKKPKSKSKTKKEIYEQADRIIAAYNRSKGGKT
ncbi:hypothetical protein [Clostridium tyrobutyricum]|uniref:hypothetical protein n=1 Tax=Clostridium tyrobutyricum TaxID=1519 RepID=UPI0010AADAE7|nr:hypothetical protein [Clostridium tyrobutyricum]